MAALLGLFGVGRNVPDIPLITGGTRISNCLGSAAVKPKTQSPEAAPCPELPPDASHPSSRIPTRSSKGTSVPVQSQTRSSASGVQPKSRLPVPCKSVCNPNAAPSPSSALSSRLEQRQAARQDRLRPWQHGAKLVATPRANVPSEAPGVPASDRLDGRRAARQDRARPWLQQGRRPAARSSSPVTTVSTVSPEPVAASSAPLRGILVHEKPHKDCAPKSVRFGNKTVHHVSFWIVRARHQWPDPYYP